LSSLTAVPFGKNSGQPLFLSSGHQEAMARLQLMVKNRLNISGLKPRDLYSEMLHHLDETPFLSLVRAKFSRHWR